MSHGMSGRRAASAAKQLRVGKTSPQLMTLAPSKVYHDAKESINSSGKNFKGAKVLTSTKRPKSAAKKQRLRPIIDFDPKPKKPAGLKGQNPKNARDFSQWDRRRDNATFMAAQTHELGGFLIVGNAGGTTRASSGKIRQSYAQLKRLVSKRDIETLKKLATRGLSVNLHNKMGSTVLMDVAWDGDVAMADTLVQLKADPNLCNSRGNTALHFAYERGHANLIAYLEGVGARRDIRNSHGHTPVDLGVIRANKDKGTKSLRAALKKVPVNIAQVQKLASKRGIDLNDKDHLKDPMLVEFLGANAQTREITLRVTQILLCFKADPNLPESENQNTPLHLAFQLGDEAVIELLLQAGAKPQLRNRSGLTPKEWQAKVGRRKVGTLPAELKSLVTAGSVEKVRKYLEDKDKTVVVPKHRKGADPEKPSKGLVNQTDAAGRTPLILAVRENHREMVSLLLEIGADPNQKEIGGQQNTALHYAYKRHQNAMVSLLEAFGADPSECNAFGFSCVEAGEAAAVVRLQATMRGRLQRKENKRATTNKKEKPYSEELHAACMQLDRKEVLSLIKKGAKIDGQNTRHNTILMEAVLANLVDVVSFLLKDHRVDVNISNLRGNTALHLAYGEHFHQEDKAATEKIISLLESAPDVDLEPRNSMGFTPKGWLKQLKNRERAARKAKEAPVSSNHRVNRKESTHLVSKVLLEACAKSDLKEVSELAQREDIDLNAPIRVSSNTVLIEAVGADNIELVQLLIQLAADVNIQNGRGDTALHMACASTLPHADEIQKYLEQVEDIKLYVRNDVGITPQEMASQKRARIRRKNKALDKAPKFSESLAATVREGDVSAVAKELSKNSACINGQSARGETALMLAVVTKNLEVVHLLVDKKADINVQNRRGNTALHLAYEIARPDIILFLLTKGGDVEVKNNVGFNPTQLMKKVRKIRRGVTKTKVDDGQELLEERSKQLREALEIVHDDFGTETAASKEIKKLIEKFKGEIPGDDIDKNDGVTAIVNLQNHVGESVLFSAVRMREVDCTRILVQYGDANLQNIRGDTVLHIANELESDKLKALLIKGGANPQLKNHVGFTPNDVGKRQRRRKRAKALTEENESKAAGPVKFSPELQKAVRSNNVPLIKELVEAGHQVNGQNPNGSTVLMDAVWNGNLDLVELLVSELGADTNIQNLRMNTALHFAYEKQHTDIILFLESLERTTKVANAMGYVPGAKKPVIERKPSKAVIEPKPPTEEEAAKLKRLALAKEIAEAVEQDDVEQLAALITAFEEEATKTVKYDFEVSDLLTAVLDTRSPSTGETALIDAVHFNNIKPGQLLLQKGADPNIQNNRGDTAMHYAERMEARDFVVLLGKHGASRDIRNRVGLTPIDIKRRRAKKKKEARRQRAKSHTKYSDDLGDAVNGDDVEGVRLCLSKIASGEDKLTDLNAPDSGGNTVLAHAVYNGNAEVATLLLQAKVDPNLQNRRGDTALHIAYEVSQQSMVKLLHNNGAKKKIKNNLGLTPSQIGKKREALLTANKNAKKDAKKQVIFNTELSAACSDGDLTAVYDIIMAGAPVNAQNKSGSTVLMDAVWNGHLDVVMALIDLKADPSITNYRMNTALHFAYMKEHIKIVEFLEGIEDLTHTRNALGQKPKHLTGTASTRTIRTSESTSNFYINNPIIKIQANVRGRNARRKIGRKK